MLLPSTIRAALRQVMADLDAQPYAGLEGDAWHESEDPETPERASGRAHLQWYATLMGGRRTVRSAVEREVNLRFMHRFRPKRKVEDLDLCEAACLAVVRALPDAPALADLGISVQPDIGWEVQVQDGSEWLLGTVTATFFHLDDGRP